MNTEDFLIRAKTIFDKNTLDYSKVNYVNIDTKIDLICKIHNIEFSQIPYSLLIGKLGCEQCRKEKFKETINNKKSKEFIDKSNKRHNSFYDYKFVKYIGSKSLVEIVCPIHGSFYQSPTNHLAGHGCKKCSDIKVSNSIKLSQEKFETLSKDIHGCKYDYSLSNYNKSINKVSIICPNHGVFEKSPNNHISKKQGCPKCETLVSIKEQELCNFLKEYLIFEQSDRKILEGYELDIFIPSKNLAIEFNGLYWHSEKFIEKSYHFDKYKKCKDNNIRLFQVFEDDWKFKEDIVKSYIRNLIGVTNNKIDARNCTIEEVDYNTAKNFLNKNHLQGSTSASKYITLKYKKTIVSLISFKEIKKNKYDLNRFCSILNTNVRGGFSKLLKYFISNYNPDEIITFSDNTYSDGCLYKTHNFTEDLILNPDYKYILNDCRKHKFNFRKNKLKKLFNNTDNKTEHNIMLENNIYRIYDAGKQRYILKPNKNE